jgi:nucleoside phosphorylase
LITANEHETDAVVDAYLGAGNEIKHETRGGVTYGLLGTHAGMNLVHTLCQPGSSGIGASQQRTREAIHHWKPVAAIAVGIAFGLDEKKQSIGDVLVSKQVQNYELTRQNNNGTVIPRGDKSHASDALINRIEQVDANRRRKKGGGWPKVRPGLVLSGEKLVDDIDYRDSLKGLHPEAIGGEMEANGLYVSAIGGKIEWIVVKAICDWGYDKNNRFKEKWQKLAAQNAAQVLKASLDLGPISS